MKFDGVLLEGSRSDPATYLNVFHNWFRMIMVESFGRHYARQSKRWLQPLTYAFIDFPGSRYRQRMSPDHTGLYDMTHYRGSSEYLRSGLLHIHAVMALTPGQGQACRQLILNSGSLPNDRFGEIDAQPFDPNKGSLVQLVDYSMKGAVLIGSAGPSDCWEPFPRFSIKDSNKSSKVAHRQSEGSSLVR
jgi:hypothetical protein